MASSQRTEPAQATDTAEPFTLSVENLATDVAFTHDGGVAGGIHYELGADGSSLTVYARRLSDGARAQAQFDHVEPVKAGEPDQAVPYLPAHVALQAPSGLPRRRREPTGLGALRNALRAAQHDV